MEIKALERYHKEQRISQENKERGISQKHFKTTCQTFGKERYYVQDMSWGIAKELCHPVKDKVG